MIRSPRVLLSVVGVGLALVLTLAFLLVPGRTSAPQASGPVPEPDLDALVTEFTSALSADQDYRPPNAAERRTAAAGLTALLDHRDSGDLRKLGFSVRDLVDPATRRPYTVVTNEPDTVRAWGLYVIDRSAPPSLVVEVPHPAYDLRTELFGVDLFRRVPGGVLLVAGAHRKADDSHADVAHESGSVFHVVAAALAARGLTQVQLHGFHDQNLPSVDIALSSGAATAGGAAHRAADRLTVAGFAVCRAWADQCTGLEGTTNVQSKAAAKEGTGFLHIEMSRTVRDSPHRQAQVIQALVDADVGRP